MPAAGQQSNPFELAPRLDSTTLSQLYPRGIGRGLPDTIINPFELVSDPSLLFPDANEVLPGVKPLVTDGYDRFKFVTMLGMLLLLTLLMTLMRNLVLKAYRGFINDNLLSQFHRDQEGRGSLPLYLLYGMFFINAGLFLFFVIQYFHVSLHPNLWIQFLYCLAAVVAAFLLKHLLLNSIGFIFPVGKEVRRYNFLIIIFSFIIGLFLAPVNLLLAYGPEDYAYYALYGAFGLIVLIYLFRALRALLIANQFLLFHRIHFLLYICTVEIAPILILIKIALVQL